MPFTAAGGTLAAVLFVLTLPFVRFSTSWPRGGSPTPNGTVCLTSWPRWSEETLHSSATLRRDASPPSLSPLSTCGERMLLLLVLSFVAVLCGELFNQLFFFFPALQRKNQRGQSTENCWWAQRNWKCKKCFKILFQFLVFFPRETRSSRCTRSARSTLPVTSAGSWIRCLLLPAPPCIWTDRRTNQSTFSRSPPLWS